MAIFLMPRREKPLEDAKHVRNATAHFDQATDVADGERDESWRRIKVAAKKFDVERGQKSWRELGEA